MIAPGAISPILPRIFDEAAPPVNVIGDIDPFFDHGWHPENALDLAGGDPVVDGADVETLVDSIAGGRGVTTMTYQGSTFRRTGEDQPTYRVDETGKFIRHFNLNNIVYSMGAFGAIGPPHTLLVVLRPRMGEDDESMIKNGDSWNIRNQNDTHFDYDKGQGAACDTTVGSWPDIYKIHSLIINSDSLFYINGVDKRNGGTLTVDDWTRMTWGVPQNILAHDLYGIWVKEDTLSAGDRADLITIIGNVWDIDTANSVYDDMENLTVEWDGVLDEWFLSIDGATEFAGWPGGTTFRWLEAGNGGSRSFSSQNSILDADGSGSPGDATSARLTRADYDILFNPVPSNYWVMCTVNIAGNINHQVEEIFVRDNIA